MSESAGARMEQCTLCGTGMLCPCCRKPVLSMNTSAAIADPRLKRDGRDWREKRDRQGKGSHVTRVALLVLVARHSAIS